MGQVPAYNELINQNSRLKGGNDYEFIKHVFYGYVVHVKAADVCDIADFDNRRGYDVRCRTYTQAYALKYVLT